MRSARAKSDHRRRRRCRAENGPVELFNAVARYWRRVSPCTSFNRTPHFSRRRITVSRSPAFCYATTALIHYSCAAETRLATWVHAPRRGENSKVRGTARFTALSLMPVTVFVGFADCVYVIIKIKTQREGDLSENINLPCNSRRWLRNWKD